MNLQQCLRSPALLGGVLIPVLLCPVARAEAVPSTDAGMLSIEDGGPSQAVPLMCDTTAENRYLAASDCPVLFGDAQTRVRHRKRREALLESARASECCIELLHHAPWKQPQRASFDGITLLAHRSHRGCPSIARIEVDGRQLNLDCPSGIYEIAVDDSLGSSGQVLAILDELVLLEIDGELKYLSKRSRVSPDWRMTWQSGWSYAMPSAAAPSSAGKKRNRGKKKKPRPKKGKRAGKRKR